MYGHPGFLCCVSLVIRIPHAATVSALRHGSSNDPSLHDISMLFSTACMDLHLPRPLLLTAPASEFPQPLSPAANRVALVDSATPRLRALVNDLALQAGAQITIDLFATSENAQCERFFSAAPEAPPVWLPAPTPCSRTVGSAPPAPGAIGAGQTSSFSFPLFTSSARLFAGPSWTGHTA